MEIVIKIVTAIVIATISSLVTVHLSRSKFRSERWWDKKASAYEKVIEAFHNSKKFHSEHMIAEELNKELGKDRISELKKLASSGRDEIIKASDIGSFVLSERAIKILSRYEAESENIIRQDSFYEHLVLAWEINNSYMKEFIEEAHRDLKT